MAKNSALDKTLETPRSRVPIDLDDLLAVESGVEDIDDATDRLLAVDIERAKKRATPPIGVDVLELASTVVADEHLALTGKRPVAYSAQSENLALLDAAIPEDLADMPGIFLDTPTDYRTAPKEAPVAPDVAREHRLAAVGAGFEWSEVKIHAAGLAALSIPPRQIAALLGLVENDVVEWHRNNFFQIRVRRLRESAPRLAWEFLQAHHLLAARKLIAIMNSGTKDNDTQLRAVKLFFDVTKFDPTVFVKNDPKKESTMANLLKAIEGESRLIENELDPAYEWAEREVGPELIKATADAQRAMRADDLRLLQSRGESLEEEFERTVSRPPATGPAVPATILEERIEQLAPLDEASVDKVLGLAPAPEWAADEAFEVGPGDLLPGALLYDPYAEFDSDDLARMRLEESDADDVLTQFLIQNLRGKKWYPILTLDPKKRAQIRAERTRSYQKARANGTWRRSAPRISHALTLVSVS